MDNKQLKQLNEDISNIINPQPLDEAKRKSVSKADVRKASKMLASARTTIDNMQYMVDGMEKWKYSDDFTNLYTKPANKVGYFSSIVAAKNSAENAWKNVNSAISEMNICLNQWDSIVEMHADMIRGKTKR